jgi:sugar lactone lactonase YvrE
MKYLVTALALFGSLLHPHSGLAQSKLYWTSHQGLPSIQRANLNGTGVEDLVTGLGIPLGIALDIAAGKMYWGDSGPDKIQRANLDGTGVEDLVTAGLEDPIGIALDIAAGKMYWTDAITQKIQRANLDGTSVEDLVTAGLDRPAGIALDVAAGKMYWTDFGTAKVQRANLDGTSVEDLVTGLSVPEGLALDVAAGKMYWADFGTAKVQRASLDGSGVEDLVTGLVNPSGIALDLARGKMYWSDRGANKIQRANLDGSGVEDLVSGPSVTLGLALADTTPGETELGPARVWIGLRNSDAVGLRVDLRVEVLRNGTLIGSGGLDDQRTGSSGFGNALLKVIPLDAPPVVVAPGDVLTVTISARRTCSGGGHAAGTVRLWYNGRAVDTGATRDAGSRVDGAVGGAAAHRYLRTSFELGETAGTSRTYVEAALDSRSPCPGRPFRVLGSWSSPQ